MWIGETVRHTSGSRSGFVTRDAIDPRFDEFARTRDAQLRDELILDNQGLAIAFAQRYRERGVPMEDLRQIASEALVRAVDRFEPERGLRFSTFAGRTIDGELKQHFRDRTWDVQVPRSTRQLALGVKATTDSLMQRLGRVPTSAEIAAALEIDVADVVLAIEASSAYRSDRLDASDRPEIAVVEAEFDRVDAAVVAPQLLTRLPPEERRAIELRFYDDCTQSEIAEMMGVSQMQISRVLQRALRRLRDDLERS